ncbi:MAG: class I SAM-dependent methyltransferase [Bradymonadia bacterium]
MFREDAIRADRLRAGQLEAVQHDVRWLVEHSPEFIEVDCPACGAGVADRVEPFTKGPMRYNRCKPCNTLYVSPRPDAQLLSAFYAQSRNYAYWNEHIFPASEAARRAHIFEPRAARTRALVERHLELGADGKLGALVEVGAGFGTFGECMTALGVFKRIVVVEPTPDLARTCRNRGLEVVESPIESADFGDLSVDVLASFEVIEHLFSPAAFLARCAQLVRPGGILLLTCPNIEGFDLTVLREASDTIEHGHLNYFNPSSLSSLVESAGFTVIETLTPGQLDVELVRKKVQAGLFTFGRTGAERFLERVVGDVALGDLYQRFLADNGLSSHLWLVARRPVESSESLGRSGPPERAPSP